MKLLKSSCLLTLLITLLIAGCKKEDQIKIPDNNTTPKTIVNGSISGMVTDQDNQPISEVLISLNNLSTTTDINGYFSFKNVDIKTRGSLVSAEKEGYFYNAKFVTSRPNKQNFTNFKLIEKAITGTFIANEGGTVTTTDGASIVFEANSIKQENGDSYSGYVFVIATWLPPTSIDLAELMPGDLRSLNAENVQQQSTTYGIIGVELESDNGQSLNIADGYTATIQLPIPEELAANAPASLTLSHFDELSGYWMEDGTAMLQDQKYVGEVSHFSFWNYNVPSDYVFIEGVITDENGSLLPRILVKVTNLANGTTGYDWTDQDGFFAGFVPNDQNLDLKIFDVCSTLLHSQTIGPFAENTNLSPIALNTQDDFLTVSGNLIDCDEAIITNGYAKIAFGNKSTILPLDADGNFNQIINHCNVPTIEMSGFDLDLQQQSTVSSFDVSNSNVLELGTVSVCGGLHTEFMQYFVNGEEVFFINPWSVQDAVPQQHVGATSETNHIFFNVPTLITGTYEQVAIEIYQENGNNDYELGCAFPDCDMILEVTTFDYGGFLIGSFEGNLEDDQGDSVPVHGTFKIEI